MYLTGTMPKTIASVLIIAIIILGWFAAGLSLFGLSGSFTGHTGYCRSEPLPGFSAICIVYLALSLLLPIYLICVSAFIGFGRGAGLFRPVIRVGLILLLYPLYSICRFPFVNQSTGFIRELQLDGIHNPLFFFGSVFAGMLLLVTARFHNRIPSLRRLAIVTYCCTGLFLVTAGSIYVFARYEICFG